MPLPCPLRPLRPLRPLLLLEINEVPWRVIDRARASGRYPSIETLFASSQTFTTVSEDTGELSPWVTWPSFHRGVGNAEHGIQNLGQDVSTFRGTPIWEEYRRRGLPIGVCGSMQSWPPVDPGPTGFFIPDTFAHDERCIPAYLEPLQRFNLSLVRKNGLVARDAGVLSKEFASLLPSIGRARIHPRTFARIAKQLVSERIDRTRVARRAIFQSLLFWDVFKGLYNPRSPPALATFFTNHVAGVMHRYWDHVFPEDFDTARGSRPHQKTMDFALKVLDEIVGDALGFARKNPELIVVFATSMGQAAIKRHHEGFSASVDDLARLMALVAVPAAEYAPLLAMVPQVAARIDSAPLRERVIADLERCVTASGKQLFLVHEVGASLSITVTTPALADIERGGFHRRPGDSALVPWAEGGVVMNRVDAGTAYHIPEGIMAVHGRGIAPSDARTRMMATKAKSYLLELARLRAREGDDETPLRDDHARA